jgi:hypothetical protein
MATCRENYHYILFSGEEKEAKILLNMIYSFLASPHISVLDIRNPVEDKQAV